MALLTEKETILFLICYKPGRNFLDIKRDFLKCDYKSRKEESRDEGKLYKTINEMIFDKKFIAASLPAHGSGATKYSLTKKGEKAVNSKLAEIMKSEKKADRFEQFYYAITH
jgi:hypothetical protein